MTSLDIFSPHANFNEQALEIFHFQAEANEVYKKYLEILGVKREEVQSIEQIPFLPIDFFKKHKVVCANFPIERVFKSSGTGKDRSLHYIVDSAIYRASFIHHFEKVYGSLDEICILALLPNYQENKDSSLLFMANELIALTEKNGSSFINLETPGLDMKLKSANKSALKTIVIGVSFALLDLAERFPQDLSNVIIMETGGMKGKRAEITRTELHSILKAAFHQENIHSEYGMCELLSQAYAIKNGIFHCPSWMQVSTRPLHEPFTKTEYGKAGLIKIIDLANVYSCSFIETADIGISYEDGSFEILGRVDYASLRGCNLMYQ